MGRLRQRRPSRMVITVLRIRSTNSIIGERMGKVVKFPNSKQRVGKKYREEEIARIGELMRLCDDDMKTILEQIDQLQEELQGLTIEYETMLARLKELLEVDSND